MQGKPSRALSESCRRGAPGDLLHSTEGGQLLQDQILWTLRFSTGRKRGSQLSELAPILLCLTGHQGAAMLKEILPWPASAEDSAQHPSRDLVRCCVRAVCQQAVDITVELQRGHLCCKFLGSADSAQRTSLQSKKMTCHQAPLHGTKAVGS